MTTPRPRLRQVHLDFHTPGEIPDVGRDFDPDAFAATFAAARAESVTLFARCHHGYSYHPTAVGTMHPGLTFDLLGAQIAALHAVGIRAPIYTTVGWDELAADEHPEWLQIDGHDRICRVNPDDRSTWRFLDLASPYADHVLALTAEVLDRYAPVDGLFFDIIRQAEDGNGSVWRRRRQRAEGIDPADGPAIRDLALRIEREFMARASSLVRERNPAATVFFNSRLCLDRDPAAGSRPELPRYSHVEIESLPGGEWGYGHYPLVAAFFQTLDRPLVGMTGIFHTAWGDFGSLKTAAALDYECSRMLASGAACSVGDHLHPRGALDPATYARLGAAFARVEALEPWCVDAEPVAEVGVLLAETGPRLAPTGREADAGAARMLLELHRPFQMLDAAADLSPARYPVLIAPDAVPFDPALASKVAAYLAAGGALLLTHRAGLTPAGDRFAPELADALGLDYLGDAPDTPDFLVADDALGAPFTAYHQVLSDRGSAVRINGADVPAQVQTHAHAHAHAHAQTELQTLAQARTQTQAPVQVLAHVGLPYLTRSPEHFYGHRQAPFDRVSDLPAVAQRGRVAYCHSPLFAAYRRHAVPAYRDLVDRLLDRLLPARLVAAPNLPTTAEVALLRQPAAQRTILHLIHAVPQRRGNHLDVVEDVLPLTDVRLGVRVGRPVGRVTLAPTGDTIPHETVDGVTWATVPKVAGHQVVAFADATMVG